MAPTSTALISLDGPRWGGWVEEVPGGCPETELGMGLDSLRELLCEALEPHSEQDGEELTFTLRWLDAAAPPMIRAWR